MAKYFDIRKLKFRMKKKIRLFLDDVNSNNNTLVNIFGGRDFRCENVWLMKDGTITVTGYSRLKNAPVTQCTSFFSQTFNHKSLVPKNYENCYKDEGYKLTVERSNHVWESYGSNFDYPVYIDKKNKLIYNKCIYKGTQYAYYQLKAVSVDDKKTVSSAHGKTNSSAFKNCYTIWDGGYGNKNDSFGFNKNPFNLRLFSNYITNSVGITVDNVAINSMRTNALNGFIATPENPSTATYFTTAGVIIRNCGFTILMKLDTNTMRIFRDSDLKKRITNVYKNYNFGNLFTGGTNNSFHHQNWALNNDRYLIFGINNKYSKQYVIGKLKSIDLMFVSGNNNIWEIPPKLVKLQDSFISEQRHMDLLTHIDLFKDFTDTGLTCISYNANVNTVWGTDYVGIGIINPKTNSLEIKNFSSKELGIIDTPNLNSGFHLMADLSDDGKELIVIDNPGYSGGSDRSLIWIFDVIYEDDDLTAHETLNGGGGNKWKIKLTLFLVFLLLIRRKYMRT